MTLPTDPQRPVIRDEPHIASVARLYDDLAANGPFGTLAPDNHGGPKSRYIAAVFDAALLPLLAGRARSDDVLLDYGCGTGIFSIAAASHVGKVFALDVSEAMLDWGKRLEAGRLGIEWLLGDGHTIPLETGSLDWVVARESLCYVTPDMMPSILSEIHRVLRPGGRFLWLEQISDNPAFQTNKKAALLEKRPAGLLKELGCRAGFELESGHCVRQPRFPWIYAVWAGLIPEALIPRLARWEVAFNRRFGSLRARRWKDALLVMRKPESGSHVD